MDNDKATVSEMFNGSLYDKPGSEGLSHKPSVKSGICEDCREWGCHTDVRSLRKAVDGMILDRKGAWSIRIAAADRESKRKHSNSGVCGGGMSGDLAEITGLRIGNQNIDAFGDFNAEKVTLSLFGVIARKPFAKTCGINAYDCIEAWVEGWTTTEYFQRKIVTVE